MYSTPAWTMSFYPAFPVPSAGADADHHHAFGGRHTHGVHGDPGDSLGIARSAARNSATLLPASPQTLGVYARDKDIHPLMFDSLRLVVSGPETLPDEVRSEFELKFGKRIYEGFGSAETTTVATVNIPDAMDTSDWKVQQGSITGTMGMPVPGTSLRLLMTTAAGSYHWELTASCGMGSQIIGCLDSPEQTAAAIFEVDGERSSRPERLGTSQRKAFWCCAGLHFQVARKVNPGGLTSYS